MPFIEIKELYKTYNPNTDAEVKALQGINLQIEQGEMIAIVGASGSGKSTLLHLIACMDGCFSGELIIDGIDIGKLNQKSLATMRNEDIGIILQNFGLLFDLDVFDNIAVPAYLSKTKVIDYSLTEKINKLLYEMNIYEKKHIKVSQLSGGQKQRVAIARALVNNPKLILADEPTGALDKSTSNEIIDLLIELNKKGKTVIIVTHDMSVAKKCNRIITISDGKLVQ